MLMIEQRFMFDVDFVRGVLEDERAFDMQAWERAAEGVEHLLYSSYAVHDALESAISYLEAGSDLDGMCPTVHGLVRELMSELRACGLRKNDRRAEAIGLLQGWLKAVREDSWVYESDDEQSVASLATPCLYGVEFEFDEDYDESGSSRKWTCRAPYRRHLTISHVVEIPWRNEEERLIDQCLADMESEPEAWEALHEWFKGGPARHRAHRFPTDCNANAEILGQITSDE